MISDPEINMLPADFICPACETQMDWQTKITGHAKQPIKKGQIIVCGHCSAVLKVGDSGLVKMSKKEIKALSATDKSILKMTVASVIANRVAQQGGEGGGPRLLPV